MKSAAALHQVNWFAELALQRDGVVRGEVTVLMARFGFRELDRREHECRLGVLPARLVDSRATVEEL